MKPLASLSLDLDNLWAYQMTHGDPGWESHPTYLPLVVPQALRVLQDAGTTITFFIVGQDAALARNGEALASIAAEGHEIGNHSFRHQPWLHRYSRDELVKELADTEDALEAATGRRPVGFRGPGYSLSPTVLDVLHERGYAYDCSTLPTVIGPLARQFYFRSAKLSAEQREERQYLFGTWKDGLRRLSPYWWDLGGGRRIVEIPVSVLPMVRVPFHLSYVLYLAGRSEDLAVSYFANGLRFCALRGVEPSILLHPLDVVGADDVDELRFFPAMGMSGEKKRRVVGRCLKVLAERFDVVPVGRHADIVRTRPQLRTVDSLRATNADSGAAA
jgi:peptidoglycan-N-acetylglucosamine deacetylase